MTPIAALWRSVLFVPAHVPRFVQAAGTRGADAIQLDLEDSVPAANKAEARSALAPAVNALQANDVTVLVRINRGLRDAVADLEAAVIAGVAAITVPKAASAGHLQLIDELMCELEQERDLPHRGIGLIAMVETLHALYEVQALATACPRMIGLTLGSEDFSAEAGMTPTPENLFQPCQHVVFAAKAAGLQAWGFPGSIAEYGQLERYRQQTAQGASMGFDGAFCIHPSQVPVLNTVFAPSAEQVAQARAVIAAYQAALAENRGAATMEGRMIDLPVVHAAEAVLQRQRATAQEEWTARAEPAEPK